MVALITQQPKGPVQYLDWLRRCMCSPHSPSRRPFATTLLVLLSTNSVVLGVTLLESSPRAVKLIAVPPLLIVDNVTCPQTASVMRSLMLRTKSGENQVYS